MPHRNSSANYSPAYTIFPSAHSCEILFLALDNMHAAAKARASIVYKSFASRLEDQFSFWAQRSSIKHFSPILQKGVFQCSRVRGPKTFSWGQAPIFFPLLFHNRLKASFFSYRGWIFCYLIGKFYLSTHTLLYITK